MTDKDMSRQDILELFVLQYRTAVKQGWSRTDLADYLGVKHDSIRRRSLTVKHQMGISLPSLPIEKKNHGLNANKIAAFEKVINETIAKSSKANETVKVINSNESLGVGRYVITSAQNATAVHQKFLSALLNYCSENSASLKVIPYRYKNPTSIFQNKDEDTWDSSIVPYLVDNTVKIAKNLVLVGSVKIQPTAVQPLSGFEGYTGTSSAIFGHPKVQLKTVPTPSAELPKILASTGAVTVANYTDSKAGFKGSFHHSLAAIIVEVTEDEFHIRHIHGQNDGSFYDLDTHYTETGSTSGHRIAALITGDTHAMFLNKDVEKATYSDDDSIVKVLKPEMRVFHDINDFFSRNHHHRGDHLQNLAKHFSGTDDVEAELQIAADLIDKYNDEDCLNVIVKSNHDEALDRWLREADANNDPRNARFYHYMKYNQIKNMKIESNGRFSSIDPFEFWCAAPDQQKGLDSIGNTMFLKRDQSLMVNGIELGFHGDVGPNGARGSIQNLSKIGTKTIIGHSHSPGIYEGVYQVGTSSDLDMGYNSGPSSWLTTHAIVYPDGKRTLIHIVNGKWRA